MDCGPACLQMIAAFHGRKCDLESIRNAAHITRQGVSILGLAKAAESIGFKTKGLKLSIDKLRSEVPLPCILHWRQVHFVVLYKISITKRRTTYFIADPQAQKISINEHELLDAWSSCITNNMQMGTCLVVELSESFFNKNKTDISKRQSGLRLVFSYARAHQSLFAQVILGLLLGSILQLVFPFLTQAIVDKGIAYKDFNILYIILAGYFFLTLTLTITDYLRRWLLLQIGTRVNIAIIADFLYKLMNLPISFFDKKLTGDIIKRIEDHKNIEKFLTMGSLSMIFSVFSITVFSIVLCYYHTGIFLLFFFSAIVYIAWVSLFMKKREQVDYKNFILESANKSSILQIISGVQDIKLNNCELQKRWEWEAIQAKLFKTRFKGLQIEQLQTVGATLINHTKTIIITLWSAKLVIDGRFSIGEMLSVQYIIGQLNSPITDIISFMFGFQDAKLAMKRLGEIQAVKSEQQTGLKDLATLSDKKIVVKDLSFKYDGADLKYVLNNINLSIPEGKITAIVGASGSGKTTLIKLLLRFYLPTEGYIAIGDKYLANINPAAWRAACGVVLQDGFLFNDTLARNIALSSNINDIDVERLLYAANVANIDDYIMNLPLKFDTIVGAEGQGLSQGQKQRILIARAVYKNPELLFFDEATNSLDTKNERQIVNKLSLFFYGKTVLIVAHRLSTVKNADQIVVMDGGRIVEVGTHSQLINQKGTYFELIKNQLELETA